MHNMIRYASPLGELTIAANERAVTALVMAGQKYEALHLPAGAAEAETPVLREARRWLDAYFAGEHTDASALPLEPEGTAFQKRVWRELLEIPWGEKRCYGEIARTLGSSARAVGSAVGRNPIGILIPCHRVLGSGGALTGYAGGLERKALLLKLEGVLTE